MAGRITSAAANNPRVLIVRLGAMGDVLHALPAVAMLRQAMPEARIGWVIERRWRELLCAPAAGLSGPRSAQRPLVDELHLVDTRAWRKQPFSSGVRRDCAGAIRHLRECKYAAALDLQGAIKSALLAALSGSRRVVGFREPRESLARMLYGKSIHAQACHVIDQNLELAHAWLNESRPSDFGFRLPVIGACGVADFSAGARAADGRAGLLPHDPESERSVAAKLEALQLATAPLAILNPGAGWAAKQWPPQRYAELAQALAKRGFACVINYGPGEEALAAEVATASKGTAQPLFTTISEFIALARRASTPANQLRVCWGPRLFVGGDTGPMHLAALLGVKTLALFGPTDPGRNGPYWPEARVLRDPASIPSYSHSRSSDPGLEKLTAGRVLEEIEALLDGESQICRNQHPL